MDIESYRNYCISLPGVTESFPFDENALCFKVGNKIFAILHVETFEFINLKCDPEKAIELREEHEGIRPGWHMNKKHWNSVHHAEGVDDQLVFELTKHSYDLIKASLPKKIRESIQ